MKSEEGPPGPSSSCFRSLVTVFSLHMLGAIPNAGPFLKFTIEANHWTRDLFTPALEVRDGHVAITDGPVWGCHGEA